MPRANNDCLRCCVARLLELPDGKVPNFVGKHRGRWTWYFDRWLARRGLEFAICRGRMAMGRAKLTWIEMGKSKRDRRYHHAILVRGGKVVYDGGVGITRCTRTIVIFPRLQRRAA